MAENIFTYKDIQEIRELQIEELKPVLPMGMTVEFFKLVEMRVQTLIMAGLFDEDIKKEVRKIN